MSRRPNKVPGKIVSMNIDIPILKEFDDYCYREDKNRSRIANTLLKEFLNANKKRK